MRNLGFGRYGSSLLYTTATLAIMSLAALQVAAQTPQLQESLAEIKEHGNVTCGATGLPGGVRLMIANYIKPKDSVVIIFNRPQKMIVSLHISSYLSDPTDAVEISAQFSKLPDGVPCLSGAIVNGVSKQLTVQIQYSDYTMP